MSKSVFCLSDNESQAERIVQELKAAGFSNNDISVLFPDKSGTRDFAHEQNTKRPKGLRQAPVPAEFSVECSAGWWGSAPWLFPASDPLSPPDRSWPRSEERRVGNAGRA